MTDSVPAKRGIDKSEVATFRLAIGALIGTLAFIALVIYGFAAIHAKQIDPWQDPTTRNALYEIVRVAVTATAAGGVGIAAALAYRKQRLGEMQLSDARAEQTRLIERDERDYRADVVARRRDRFATAASQLADTSIAVRIAGVYTLAGLVDEWLEDSDDQRVRQGEDRSSGEIGSIREAQVCADVLCAYMRIRAMSDATHPEPDTSQIQWDIAVRQTIIRVISSRLSVPVTAGRPNMKAGPWSGLDFDFTGVRFNGVYSFDGAHFLSSATFANAEFVGGSTSFARVILADKHARLNFRGALFGGAEVNFNDAYLGTVANFSEVRITGGFLQFFRTQFGDGSLCHFDRIVLEGGNFRLQNIALGVEGLITFREGRFSNGTFRIASVAGTGTGRLFGLVDFRQAVFNGANCALMVPLHQQHSGAFGFEDAEVSSDACLPRGLWPPSADPIHPLPDKWPDRSGKS